MLAITKMKTMLEYNRILPHSNSTVSLGLSFYKETKQVLPGSNPPMFFSPSLVSATALHPSLFPSSSASAAPPLQTPCSHAAVLSSAPSANLNPLPFRRVKDQACSWPFVWPFCALMCLETCPFFSSIISLVKYILSPHKFSSLQFICNCWVILSSPESAKKGKKSIEV